MLSCVEYEKSSITLGPDLCSLISTFLFQYDSQACCISSFKFLAGLCSLVDICAW